MCSGIPMCTSRASAASSATRRPISATSPPDANAYVARQALGDAPFLVSLKNGGGIRAQIGTVSDPDPVTGEIDKLPPAANPDAAKPEGGVSQLDVENSLRFDNKLMVYDTTPQGLLNILNWGAGLSANNGGFPQIGGVKYSFDPDLPGNSGSTPGSRIRDVALVDDDGNVIAVVVDDGVVVAGAPALIRAVTLNFTANGGDGYPVKANAENFRYLLTDGTLSGPINEALDFTASANVPANAMGEQRAFADFMDAFHGTPATAYDQADTPQALDTRIQNLNVRDDTVFSSTAIAGTQSGDVVTGTAGNDTINGLGGNDFLFGQALNDILTGGAGADIIDGGTGIDTAVYSGSRLQYLATLNPNGSIHIVDARAGAPDGIDDVSNVEFFRFSDMTVSAAGLLNNNHAPVASAPDFAASRGQVINASSLFSASDADGDNLMYFFYDNSAAPTSGHFTVNGVVQAAGTIFAVSAAQLAQTTFTAGSSTSDDLFVNVWDGNAFSGPKEFHVNVPANRAPVVTAADVSAAKAQVLDASSLVSASDADGDNLLYFFYDNSAAPASGHFTVNGVVQAAGMTFAVSAAQLGSTTFTAGTGSSDDLFVNTWDGSLYSGPKEFHVNIPANQAPTVTAADVSASKGQVIAASSLFTANDANGDSLMYFFYDNSANAASGHFTIKRRGAGGGHDFRADGGAAGADDLHGRDSDLGRSVRERL